MTMTPETLLDERYAHDLDAADVLAPFRSRFAFPQHEGRDAVYLCGNSLGLMPRSVRSYIEQELHDWQTHGVEGHFRAKTPWFGYHHSMKDSLARLVGAHRDEVVAMNALTVNLHLLMTSFYRPTAGRHKIVMEAGAFPSDMYAVETQVRHHGLNPEDSIVEVSPRPGEHTLRQSDIEEAIAYHGQSVALVLFSGVQYYTGQAFDIEGITRAAHAVGAYAGFDLAHAVGNLRLALHDHDVDFAVWCSYKYLNSGPGGVAGAYVHRRHGADAALPRLGGWWGNSEQERFLMKKGFRPSPSVDSWQLSNAPVLSMAAHRASLEIFDEAGIDALAAKRDKLTAYLEQVVHATAGEAITVITPANPAERGAQLSLIVPGGKEAFNRLTERGVIADWREPDVIRVAPAPLYNSFEDVRQFGLILRDFFAK
jgi:kynureninase